MADMGKIMGIAMNQLANTVDGNIVSQPYMSGNLMTVTVESAGGKKQIKTFSLPGGGLKTTVPV